MKLKAILFSLILFCVYSCTDDRDINTNTNQNLNSEIIHYWDFNDESNLTQPTQSIGGTSMQYLGAYFDSVEGTDLNAKLDSEAGTAIRLRNPSETIIINMPTSGYEDIFLSYATTRTGSGAQIQTISYSIDGANFTSAGLVDFEFSISEAYIVKQFDFSSILGTTNNSNFKIKISFSSGNDNLSGNNRIDNLLLEGVPTGDDIPNFDEVFLLHYWNFNSLPSGTLTASINADFSLLNTSLTDITYDGIGSGYMDQFSSITDLNARNNDVAGLGIRFRNPSNTRNVVVTAPTTGYKDVIMKFATARSGSGAENQEFSYSLDGVNFINTNLPLTTFAVQEDPAYEIVTLDFSAISGVNNNSNFKVKIAFTGTQASGSSGNNRFDNLTFEAKNN